jgi:hypothetical protein
MGNSREEIPQWTWYNGQFLFQFDEQLQKNPNQTISQFYAKFLENQEIQNQNFYHTKNQGTVILLMYGLLVIPKEIWETTATNFKFKTRNKFLIKILPTNNGIDTLDFLRLLRNSLSHANFSIDTKNKKLNFWNNYNGTKNFEVEIRYSDLGKFLTEVGKYYINEVKSQ